MSIEKLPTSASLKQVMDKFEEISLQDFSNIDIVVKNELPKDVKENMIVIISDITPSKILADTKLVGEVDMNDNDVYIKLSHDGNKFAECKYLASKNISVNVYLEKVYIKSNSVASLCNDVYMGIEGEWVKVLDSKVDIFANGAYLDEGYAISRTVIDEGSISNRCYASIVTDPNSEYQNTICVSYSTYSGTTADKGILYNSRDKIDLTKFSKLIFLLDYNYTGAPIRFSVGKTSGDFLLSSSTILQSTGSNIEVEVDVSNINEDMYIKIDTYFKGIRTGQMYIKNIYLTV